MISFLPFFVFFYFLFFHFLRKKYLGEKTRIIFESPPKREVYVKLEEKITMNEWRDTCYLCPQKNSKEIFGKRALVYIEEQDLENAFIPLMAAFIDLGTLLIIMLGEYVSKMNGTKKYKETEFE